ncbi:hypothetical protein [Sandaracinobacteroides hominis]|nr:hypothetical protein [Sandaracinobacteroides hominis]
MPADRGGKPKVARKSKDSTPVWVPFAWAIFGFVVWIIVSGRYG